MFSKTLNFCANNKVLIFSSITITLIGLLWIFFPILDGASEIFFPGSYYIIEFLIAVTIVILFHITCFVVASFYKRSIKYIIYMLIPLGLLLPINYLLYPNGLTRVHRRIDSFQLGARYRVLLAGGPSKVRKEALSLLNTTSEASPERNKWPDSIKALKGYTLHINREARLIDIAIPRRRFFFWGDQFGYLITDANAAEPVIAKDPRLTGGHRLWKIDDGIYLYEEW